MCCEESSARPWVSWTRLQDAVAGPTGVLVRPVTAQEMRPRIFDSAASVGQGGGRWRGGSQSAGTEMLALRVGVEDAAVGDLPYNIDLPRY
jgi:hypothetical protein